ncbi:Cellulose synthase operon protein C precursor [Kluyvera cryocrescens]|uniref:Cellulose synthase operon protein C n=1 Tax=Kluyvera cryocrescens TaxID=580 RepID=A0A485AN23_KLUCR|nr:Cellulose synthase operon protein C precursor [Kluyvera cryocrescens]
MAARLRYLLRQGDTAGAKKQLDKLAQVAPNSAEYNASRVELGLNTDAGRQEATAGAPAGDDRTRAGKRWRLTKKPFNGAPPDGDYAVEYWSTVAKIPARRDEALKHLQSLNQQKPRKHRFADHAGEYAAGG